MRGVDHVGIAVPDLDAATKFFVNAIGCQAAYKLGPFEGGGTTWMLSNLDVDASARLMIQTLRCGDGANVELFAFETPTGKKVPPRRDDVGSASIGFYFDDLPAAIARVRGAGGTILGEIKAVADGPIAGERWVYSRTAWGQYIFLMTAPGGTKNDKHGDVKLWSPRKP